MEKRLAAIIPAAAARTDTPNVYECVCVRRWSVVRTTHCFSHTRVKSTAVDFLLTDKLVLETFNNFCALITWHYK